MLGTPTVIGTPGGRTTLAVDDNDIFVLADGSSTSLARVAFDGTLGSDELDDDRDGTVDEADCRAR